MLKAVGEVNGCPLLLIGLSEENIRRLQDDQPIVFDTAELGLPPTTVVVAGGHSDETLRTALDLSGLIDRIGLMLRTDMPDKPAPEAYAGAQRALMAAWTDLRDDPVHAEQLAAVAVGGAWSGFRGTPAVAQGERFVCPRCGRVSSHPTDLQEGYCGACHDFTGMPRPPAAPPTGPAQPA